MSNFECVDCNIDTNVINEYYMVHDDIWLQSGLDKKDGMLCIGCLETRLNRELNSNDFTEYPINIIGFIFRHSERLKNRITR